jgi:undecaprenyl diphosphate synthase
MSTLEPRHVVALGAPGGPAGADSLVEPHGPDAPVERGPEDPLEADEPGGAYGPGIHLAIIMDGNGRWATARGLPRVAGHQEGARAVRETVKAVLSWPARVHTLTLYAFSADNWRRPAGEVCALMTLFERFLRSQAGAAVRERVRVSIIGRRDRLSPTLLAAVDHIEEVSRRGRRLHVRLAVDYSGREAIWQAVTASLSGAAVTRERFEALVASGRGEPARVPPVDLMVRTGGEQRLSDFLLWECAYAELCFLPVMWPDFTSAHLEAALAAFAARERRFGGLAGAEAGP